MGKAKKTFRKIWHFLWEEDSIWSWLVNIALAFLIIKFLIYPGLGFALGTTHPVVAVVSESMEHNGIKLDAWYDQNEGFYAYYNITEGDFSGYRYKNGFNKGDIMILIGKKPEKLDKGDVIVFFSSTNQPIIHRIIKEWEVDDDYYFQTKGDNNPDSIALYVKYNSFVPKGTVGAVELLDETEIHEDEIVGKAVARVPLLGYIKIGFVKLMRLIGVVKA